MEANCRLPTKYMGEYCPHSRQSTVACAKRSKQAAIRSVTYLRCASYVGTWSTGSPGTTVDEAWPDEDHSPVARSGQQDLKSWRIRSHPSRRKRQSRKFPTSGGVRLGFLGEGGHPFYGCRPCAVNANSAVVTGVDLHSDTSVMLMTKCLQAVATAHASGREDGGRLS